MKKLLLILVVALFIGAFAATPILSNFLPIPSLATVLADDDGDDDDALFGTNLIANGDAEAGTGSTTLPNGVVVPVPGICWRTCQSSLY